MAESHAPIDDADIGGALLDLLGDGKEAAADDRPAEEEASYVAAREFEPDDADEPEAEADEPEAEVEAATEPEDAAEPEAEVDDPEPEADAATEAEDAPAAEGEA